MKIIYPFIGFMCFALVSCGSGNSSTEKKDSLVSEVSDSIPHEVKKGNGSTYAYMPDTCIQSLILGNAESFRLYNLKNGSNMNPFGNNRNAISYYNHSHSEKMQILITKNSSGKNVVYVMIAQKNDSLAPKLAKGTYEANEYNFVSGHGVYLGMSEDYVMSVYSNQFLMKWQKGDTLYLQYKPKPKDFGHYKRFKPETYSATYKFVGGALRRYELQVNASEFEN